MSEQGAIPRVGRLIDGQCVDSAGGQWRNVADPADPASRQVLARVPFAPVAEPNAAAAGARMAFRSRRKTPIAAGTRIPLNYRQPIRRNLEKLAAIRTAAQVKSLADAEGGGLRGRQLGGPALYGKPTVERAQTRTVPQRWFGEDAVGGPLDTSIALK
ncbi:aldehyde dehydrogenase family protein [Azotobacter salinestris]|uniref:aldehyde dehydrogenase family protein n=1 Tax=Azotobacter salinestris TaxID=69964 RepID=UPI0032E02BC1